MNSVIVNTSRSQPESAEGGLKVLYRKSQQEKNLDLPLRCETVGRPLLRGVNPEAKRAALMRPDCGTWACPHCSKKNLARLRHLISFGTIAVGRLQPIQFVTLTSHERLATPAETYKVLSLAWNKLNRRLKRAAALQGQQVYYVAIPEQHKSRRWHLHMLVSPPMPLRWWKDNARQCGLGYQCAVRDFEQHGRAGAYMQKYLRKSVLGGQGWSKSMRRVRHSDNWPVSEQMIKAKNGWTWAILPAAVSIRDEIDRLIESGYRVAAADSVFDDSLPMDE